MSEEDVAIVGADGKFSENWTERFDEGDRDTLSRFDNIDDFVKSHMSQRRRFDKDPDVMVEIPKDDSSDEVKAAWAKAHNVPEQLDGYEYALPAELTTKLGPLDDKRMLALREYAKGKNWSPSDFKDNLDFYHKMMSGDIDAFDITFNEQKAADADKGTVELKKLWLGDYDTKVLRANAIMRKYGGEDAVASFNAENSPAMAVFLDKIAESMSESTLKGLAAQTGPTSGDIKSKVAVIRSEMDKIEKENLASYRGDARYKDLALQKTELYKQSPA